MQGGDCESSTLYSPLKRIGRHHLEHIDQCVCGMQYSLYYYRYRNIIIILGVVYQASKLGKSKWDLFGSVSCLYTARSHY